MRQIKRINNLIIESFRIAFPQKGWLLLLLLYFAVAVPILYLSGYKADNFEQTSYYYVLSAQAQTLGTILALVFTVTLVTAQLLTRYGHLLLHRVLAPWTFWYSIPFLLGIIAPLFLLNGSIELWAARLILLLGGMCLILLVLFFVVVRRQLSMASIIEDLRDSISDSSSDDIASEGLKALSSVLIGALNLKDYDTFSLGIECIEKLSESKLSGEKVLMMASELKILVHRSIDDRIAMETLLDELNKVSLHVYDGEDTGIKKKLIGNLADTYKYIPSLIIRDSISEVKVIKTLGIEGTTHPSNEITRECQRVLHNVGRVTIIEAGIDVELPMLIISALGEIAQSCINKPVSEGRKGIIATSIRRIEDLGVLVNSRKLKGLTESIVDQLNCLEEQLAGYDEDLLRAAKAARDSVKLNVGN